MPKESDVEETSAAHSPVQVNNGGLRPTTLISEAKDSS